MRPGGRFGGPHGGHGGRGGPHGFDPRGFDPRGFDPRGERGGPWGEDDERGPRPRRVDGGELRLLLLHLLSEESRHGYELIRAIEALSQGVYAPSPGMVYPALAMLKEMGLLVELEEEGQRKRFAVTEQGHAHLTENAEALAALRARLAGLGQARERPEAAPVRRAMMNLKLALGDALSAGATREAALAIAAILDEAAQKIERIERVEVSRER